MDARRTDTRKRILQLAINTIKKSGYRNISVRVITNNLGISGAAFYNHFESKEELLNEVLREASFLIYNSYDETRLKKNGEVDPIRELEMFAEHILKCFMTDHFLMEFLFFSPNALDAFSKIKSFEDPDHKVLSEGYRLIYKLKDVYHLSSDPDLLYMKCWSFFQGYSMLLNSNAISYKEGFIYDVIKDIINGDLHRSDCPY